MLGNAKEQLRAFTRELGYPITQTLMGLGAYPASDKQFIGMLGMHGTYESNMAMHECDVLIAIGARFDDRVTGESCQLSVRTRKSCMSISTRRPFRRTVTVDVPIVGDVGPVLDAMLGTD